MKLKNTVTSYNYCLCCSTRWSGCGSTKASLQEPNYPANCAADKSFKPVVNGICCIQQRNSCCSAATDLCIKAAATATAAAAGTELYISSQPARYDTIGFVPD